MVGNIWYVTLLDPYRSKLTFFVINRSMLRDESVYPDASTFKPERFMEVDPEKQKLMDPRNYVFGFGRRRVPRILSQLYSFSNSFL